jgi:hypothetical protein
MNAPERLYLKNQADYTPPNVDVYLDNDAADDVEYIRADLVAAKDAKLRGLLTEVIELRDAVQPLSEREAGMYSHIYQTLRRAALEGGAS